MSSVLFIHSVKFKKQCFCLYLLKEMLLSWFPELTPEKKKKKRKKKTL